MKNKLFKSLRHISILFFISLCNFNFLFSQENNALLPPKLISLKTELAEYQKADDFNMQGFLYAKIAEYYKNDGNEDEAVLNYESALRCYTKLKSANGIITISEVLGMIYFEQKKYQLSIDRFQQALTANRETSGKNEIALSLINISKPLLEHGKLDEALKTLKESLSLGKEMGDLPIISESHYLLAKVYKSLNSNQESMANYDNYLFYSKKINQNSVNKAEDKVKAVLFEKSQLQEAKERIQQKLDYTSVRLLESQLRTQKLAYDNMAKKIEQQKQQDAATKAQAKLSATYRLYYYGLIMFLIFTFIIFVSISKLKVPLALSKSVILFCILLSFEFLLVLVDRYTDNFVDGNPFYKLVINFIIALVVLVLHNFITKTVSKKVML